MAAQRLRTTCHLYSTLVELVEFNFSLQSCIDALASKETMRGSILLDNTFMRGR